MKTMKTRTLATLATVLLLALVGCQSESPTEPSTGGGGGTNPPTSDIQITLTASNPNPPVGSTTVITAQVTSAGASVVNGTAIEFATTFGTFIETADVFALRTTSGGAARVTLTSAEAGGAVVTARLGTVSKSINISFKVDGGGPGPQVSSVTPASGPPSGNQVVTITGSNFRAPVRVFFGSKEATVVSVTETQIKAITPSTNLGVSQQFLEVDVRVLSNAGTPDEAAGTLANGYRYELEILTPSLIHVSPASGPNEGNTRITIFGEGFQSPVKVFFGAGSTQVELDVLSVTFSQIQAITPPASGLGSGFLNNSVSLRVLNLASNTEATLSDAFRYGPRIEITGVSPSIGSHLGGDRVTIFGFGFDDPVQVSLAGVPAQVIRVSGTEVVVISGSLQGCGASGGGTVGPVSVTNLEQPSGSNNATLQAGFGYQVTTKILSVTQGGGGPLPLIEGQAAQIAVEDPGPGAVKFTIGGKTVFPTSASTPPGSSVTTYTVVVPTGLTFEEDDCTTGTGVAGTALAVTDFEIEFTNISNSCSTGISIPIAPVSTACVTLPTIGVSPLQLAFGNDDADGVRDSATLPVTVTNVGSVPVTLVPPSAPAGFVIVTPPASLNIPVGQFVVFQLGFNPTTETAFSAEMTFAANGGNTVPVTLTGTGTAVGP